jgi:homoserine dehydrogenase
VQLRFEGAVAGVVPVIRVLQESLAAAHVERIHGIVNGTTNYILSEMARSGISYETALGQAQELGYAEADPTDDVTGRDAAAKMAILARLAFSTPVHLDQVVYEGIEHITADDMAYADELGLGLKLIGTAERVNGGISVRVHPASSTAATRWPRSTARSTRSPSSPRRSRRSPCPARAPAARRPRAPCWATSSRP